MLSAAEIRNVKFSKSMSGYKQEEVEILLDKVEADYAQFERIIKDFQAKVESLETEISELKDSQSSIQNVLLSAQKLADNIVAEAKEKSDEIVRNAEANIAVITAREKELSAAFELKAQERKSELEKELSQMVNTAKLKADSMALAAQDSVEKQQLLFDKLKMEIAAFKASVSAKYKEHLEILSTLPDSVPTDPKYIAQVVATAVDKTPDPLDFVKEAMKVPVMPLQEDVSSDDDTKPFSVIEDDDE
ncbi:MAG: DivIVA domain-containing protein [Clostridia bacterium]|nr:DivIVA domain-containing protein [Clostridia bacterium]